MLVDNDGIKKDFLANYIFSLQAYNDYDMIL